MATLWQDIKYAFRSMAKRPGFALTAVLVLSLGIGVNAAVFSVVNALLLKPLNGGAGGSAPVVGLYQKSTERADEYRQFSYPNFVDIRESARTFAGVAAFDLALGGITEGDVTRRSFVCFVSSNYFDALRVALARGRAFTPDEERPGRPSLVTVVSHEYWRRTGSNPDIVGTDVRVNGQLFTVVGIAPPGFTGTSAAVTPEFWMPLSAADLLKNDFMRESQGKAAGSRDRHDLFVVGRLRDGATMEAAGAEAAAIGTRLAEAYPAENGKYTIVVNTLPRMGINTNPSDDGAIVSLSTVLMGLASIVLMVACLNLANMLLARGTARRKEIAIRLSIGASRSTVIRQLLTEGLVLSLAGGLGGLFLASGATALLLRSVTTLMPVPVVFDVSADWRVFLVTLAFAVVATLAFALGPALRVTKPDVVHDLKAQAGEDRSRRARLFGTRNLLLASQVALSLSLLVTGALFVRGAVNAANATPGFGLDRGLLVEVDPSLAGFGAEESAAAHRSLLAHLRTVTGVEAVSMASIVPFGAVNEGESVERSTAAEGAAGSRPRVGSTFTVIGSDYFQALGLAPIRGREFTASEAEGTTPARVAIIDDTLAEQLFADGEDPLGQYVQTWRTDPGFTPEALEIVGVVPSLRQDLFDPAPRPHLYVPFSLKPRTWMNYHARIAAGGLGEGAMLEQLRREIRAYDERLPILTTRTLRTFVADSVFLWVFRSAARIFTVFGVAALLLALVGIYGVNAYVVARRTREIGIRMALGATSRDVLRLVLRESAIVTAVGVTAGTAMAIGIGTALQSMLYEVTAFDPVALVAVPILLAASTLAASAIPARRAARVAPVSALRYE